MYFFHQELRLCEKMLDNHKDDKNFTSFNFKDFEEGKNNEAIIAGTIMSVKEKKTIKGTSFAIV